MRPSLFLIPLLLSSAACSQTAEAPAKEDAATASAGAQASAAAGGKTATARASSAGGFEFKKKLEENGGSLEFEYSWSEPIAAETELAALLDKDRRKRLEEETREWRASAGDCPTDAASCSSYSYANGYEVVANLPRFLSLSNGFYTYTGGAHGNYGRGSALWDREAKALIETADLFTSREALAKAVLTKACAKLDKERLDRRGEVIEGSGEEDWPNNCPGVDETTLFLGSSNGSSFNRLGLYYGPYVAGPYAEGEYEIDLPVDSAVIAAVKPEYRRYFSVKR